MGCLYGLLLLSAPKLLPNLLARGLGGGNPCGVAAPPYAFCLCLANTSLISPRFATMYRKTSG